MGRPRPGDLRGRAIRDGPGRVPLLTHCEGGTGGVDQLRLLEELGVPPAG